MQGHPPDHPKIDREQRGDCDRPHRDVRAWRRDAHLEQRRPALPLAVVLRFLQRVENEGHRSTAMCGVGPQQRRIGRGDRARQHDLRLHSCDAVYQQPIVALKLHDEFAQLGVE